jgi:hypothetical protein
MQAYTVKVPAQWAGINSVRAQTYLREFFIRPLVLPADPGAGEQVLRLTLNERQVDALSRGSGDVPAIALRRLLAARVRELPPAPSPAAAPSAPATVKPTVEVRGQVASAPRSSAHLGVGQAPLRLAGNLPQPGWFTDTAAWYRLDSYAQEQMAAHPPGQAALDSLGAGPSKKARVSTWRDVLASPVGLVVAFVVAVVLILVLGGTVSFGGGAGAGGAAGAAGPPGGKLWRPE